LICVEIGRYASDIQLEISDFIVRTNFVSQGAEKKGMYSLLEISAQNPMAHITQFRHAMESAVFGFRGLV
jgi:hypothetical protein